MRGVNRRRSLHLLVGNVLTGFNKPTLFLLWKSCGGNLWWWFIIGYGRHTGVLQIAHLIVHGSHTTIRLTSQKMQLRVSGERPIHGVWRKNLIHLANRVQRLESSELDPTLRSLVSLSPWRSRVIIQYMVLSFRISRVCHSSMTFYLCRISLHFPPYANFLLRVWF